MTIIAAWEKIPAPVRTIINVAIGAALAALVTYLTSVVSGGSFDPGVLLSLVLTAIGTAVVRAVNPADTAYGVGAGPDTTGLVP